MKILALDSSALTASAAVCDGERLLAEHSENNGHTHSETLLPIALRVLDRAGLEVDDIDAFAVSAGPGSFTGVRIGVSLIKGLAFGRNKPCYAVSTLEALSLNLKGTDGVICSVMDARRNQLYNALFSGGKRLCPDRLISAGDLGKELAEFEKVYFVGDGLSVARAGISLPCIAETPEDKVWQSAYSVALCALEMQRRGEQPQSDAALSPSYLRPSQAERERKEKERIKQNEQE